jgi:UDP-N-acetylglucosamine transferase subunit ALG13
LILCLIGTSPYSFERLVKKVDETIANDNIVFIQIGHTAYKPKNCNFTKFVENTKLLEMIKGADLIITQGGYGSMMDAIQLNKKVIAIPREEKYKELIGNQSELVEYFASKKYVAGCYDIEMLEALVNRCMNNEVKFKKFIPESATLISVEIERYLNGG